MGQVITDFNELVQLIQMLPTTNHSNVIGLSGFGGSGKTTLAARLAGELDAAAIVAADDFTLKDYRQRSSDWTCIDRPRLLAQVLRPADDGKTVRYQAFDWGTNRLGTERTVTGDNIIVEGIGIIHPQLLPYFDFSIWLDMDLQTAAERGMARDRQALGADHDELWRKVWMLNDQEYFDKYRPDALADCVYRA